MTLAHITTTAPVFTGTNVAPTTPAAAEGDHAFLLASAKQWTKDFDASTFGGWTLLFSTLVPEGVTNGNGVAGQGQQRVGVFYQKVPAGGLAATAIGLTGSGANTVASGTISVWRSDTGADVDLATAVGSETATVSAQTITATSDPGFTAGDGVLTFTSWTDDAPRFNAGWAISAPGATFSALTEAADAGSSTGDDVNVGVHVGTVTAGTSTANPTLSGTMSAGAGTTGGTVFTRIREVGGGTPGPVAGSGDLTAGSPTMDGAGTVSLTGSATLTGSSPSIAGAGTVAATGSATLTAASPTLAATGILTITGAGVLTAGSPILAGSSTLRLTGVGTLAANTPALAGSGTITEPEPDTVTGAGTLTAAGPTLTGFGTLRLAGTGALAAGSPSLVGSGTLRLAGAGALTPAAPSLVAAGVLAIAGAAGLAAGPPSLSGSGALRVVGAADLAAQSAALDGHGLIVDPRQFRDITLTVGPLTAHHLTASMATRVTAARLAARDLDATINTRTLDGELLVRALTATLED